MQSLVVVGKTSKINEYINEFVSSKKIKPYNIIRTGDRTKISEAREIKKIISLKANQKEARLIILTSDITLEAQNALLKTLEEVPDNIYFMITAENKENLIDTILSRCKIVNLAKDTSAPDDNLEFEKEIKAVVSAEDKIKAALLLSERFEGKDSRELLDRFMSELRKSLIDAGTGEDKKTLTILWRIVYGLNNLYPLLVKNNINKRMALENIILEST